MNVEAFLNEIRKAPDYADQIVYVHEAPAREAVYAEPGDLSSSNIEGILARFEIERLYGHQAEAIRLANEGKDVLVATGTASGKTLCYTLPIVETLQADPQAKALLLFPTKALCQDQFKNFGALLEAAGCSDIMAGVFDGDTPSSLRRKLRDHASVIFSNPDMVHASLMPQHARWAEFLGQLKILVLDELHVYSGIFGSNMALLLRRFFRICKHYGSDPQIIACSATIADPRELGEQLTGRTLHLVDKDGSPRARMLLPLFMTCDTLDFSHTVGSVNAPWNAIFVYERILHGLGFTEKAYERLDQIMPMVLDNIKKCPCKDGCPCCVGKPLRPFTTWNVERGEASIPSKAAALMILEGVLGDGTHLRNPDSDALTDADPSVPSQAQDSRTGGDRNLRLERALRRRLERMREPQMFHPITPKPGVKTEYPATEKTEELAKPDVAKRSERRQSFERDLHKRIAKQIETGDLSPDAGSPGPPKGMKTRRSNLRPTDFPGRPEPGEELPKEKETSQTPVALGDALAARARKLHKKKRKEKSR